jgi:hypothetical protein
MERAARLAAVAGLFAMLVGMTRLGVSGAIQEQPNLRWAYIGGALLAFVSGLSVAMAIISYLHRCFQIEIEEEEKKVGRFLSELEVRRIGERFREKRQGGTNVPFPLQRLVTRFLLLLPAAILSSFVVIISAFFSGFFLAAFVEEYRKRTLPYF